MMCKVNEERNEIGQNSSQPMNESSQRNREKRAVHSMHREDCTRKRRQEWTGRVAHGQLVGVDL
jgi:hypothetical protein